MILKTRFNGDILLPVSIRNSELAKLVRVFIKNTLIYDYESETPTAGMLSNLATLLTQFSVMKFPVSVGAVHNYTCYLISPDNIMAFVKAKDALSYYMTIDGLVIENFECYGIAYQASAILSGDNAYIAKDFTMIGVVEPKETPLAMAEVKERLDFADVILGQEAIRTRLAELNSIQYPDFDNMVKADLEFFINMWNNVYPDNQIVPSGNYKADLLNAIKEKVGL